LYKSDKTLPDCTNPTIQRPSLERKYSIPVLKKGKQITSVPKGSNKLIEQAKQSWHVEFFYEHPITIKNIRIRITDNLNRIKDPLEKLNQFEKLLNKYSLLLENGYNPFEKQSSNEVEKKLAPLTLIEARVKFETYHKAKNTRAKSIKSYLSKIDQFIDFMGDNKKVVNVKDIDIINYLHTYALNKSWTGVTYNMAKVCLNNLFKYLLINKYVEANPVTLIERRKQVKTELHQVFTDEDFKLIMEWLRLNDPYCLLFVQMIYYTCIRPKELRLTQLKFIDLDNQRIIIPASVSKNKKSLPVKIDKALMNELVKLNLDTYPTDYYLFGNTKSIVASNKIGENTPYKRFNRCLQELGLLNKNYTLYSFKHLSNVRKYLAGWSIAEICSANRHSSLVETETYLKDLIKFIPMNKDIPVI